MNSLRGTPEYQPRPRIILPSANIDTAVGTADKILDFFLRRKRILAKYTKEEKQKAIDFFIRYCKQATLVSRNLDILMSGTHWSTGTGDMKRKVK